MEQLPTCFMLLFGISPANLGTMPEQSAMAGNIGNYTSNIHEALPGGAAAAGALAESRECAVGMAVLQLALVAAHDVGCGAIAEL